MEDGAEVCSPGGETVCHGNRSTFRIRPRHDLEAAELDELDHRRLSGVPLGTIHKVANDLNRLTRNRWDHNHLAQHRSLTGPDVAIGVENGRHVFGEVGAQAPKHVGMRVRCGCRAVDDQPGAQRLGTQVRSLHVFVWGACLVTYQTFV